MTKIGRIYKIICSQSDDVYIGSTFNELRVRFKQHKDSFNRWLDGKRTGCAIYAHFQRYGFETFKMVLIKEYEVVDRSHLEAYEQLWISKTRCVNKQAAFSIEPLTKIQHLEKCKQYKQANKDKISEWGKQYREANKNTIKIKRDEYKQANKANIAEKGKEYYELNKELITAKNKQYRDANPDKMKNQSKQYREANKEAIKAKKSEKIQCECGVIFARGNGKLRHERSGKHKKWLSSQ